MSTVTAAPGTPGRDSLVYSKEGPLFAISMAISAIAWLALVLGTVGIALVWILGGFIIYLFAQSALISHLRGSATEITPQQFPDLYERVKACSAKLGMSVIPDAYLLHAGGAFNAFATRFLGRNFIVLYSDVVDALEAEPDALDFYIGHELGHLRRGHLVWGPFLFPASILPLLGAAYSRAREYTCDLHGLACCKSPEVAARGLAALAAGGKRWKTLDIAQYAGQSGQSSGFWMSFHELTGSYPWLSKRMARILGGNALASVPGRNPFAWIFALFVPRLGAVGGGGSVFVTVAMIGILAAVALPAYQDYTVRAKMATALQEGDKAANAVAEYYYRTSNIPPNLAAAGFAPSSPLVSSISVNDKGVVRVELAFSPVQGKGFVLVPSLDASKRVVWRCTPGEVEPKYLPVRCR